MLFRTIFTLILVGIIILIVLFIKEKNKMLLEIGIGLLLLWFIGLVAFPVLGFFIHILLVLAVISIVWHLVAGKK